MQVESSCCRGGTGTLGARLEGGQKAAVARGLEKGGQGEKLYISSFPAHIIQHFHQNRSVSISHESGYKRNGT